ncbi:MAG: hypothetical protein JJ966_12090 [Balneolaceae bacterium]|nr:hypothetical protein [Balneolaceae bacterium]
MSRSEILSWTSLATTTSVMVFYVLMVFGWPDAIPDFSSKLFKVFFNVFWIAVIVEIVVEISESSRKVVKDERDHMIEGKGHKIGYAFLVFGVMVTLIQLFISNTIGPELEEYTKVVNTTTIFHFLFITLYLASTAKRSVMIYYYRTK